MLSPKSTAATSSSSSTSKQLGGSMNFLDCIPDYDNQEPKLGLLRRAFSSKRRRKNVSHSKYSHYLSVPSQTGTSSSGAKKNSADHIQVQDDQNDHYLNLVPRGSFSRKNYGSIEMLLNRQMESYMNNAGRFRVEQGSSASQSDLRNSDPLFSMGNSCWSTSNCKQPVNNPVHLENPEQEIRWYFKYFLGKLHQIYMGLISERDPVVMATVISDLNNNNINQYRVIMWRKLGSQKLCIPYNPSNPLTIKKILSSLDQQRFEKFPKEIFNYEGQKDVLTLEEQEGSVNFKFGVLFCKIGQKSDEEMYNNDDTTGTESFYTIYEGHEVMFHVSTMLPISSDNRQQIERKRHVGNDIVNIIYIDGVQDEPFERYWTPSMMKTHFTHIFAIVTFNRPKGVYRLSVFSEESVPLFGPPLPFPAEFTNKFEFREFLLVKLINGEKAAFHTPVFADKRERTMEMLLQNILHQNISENQSYILNRRAFSDIVLDHGNGISTTKEMTRNDAFIKFGQMLKVNIIIKGDAPTSAITTGIVRRMPWQPKIFANDLHYVIHCGDTWAERLILCTERGTVLLEENTAPLLVIEKSWEIKQIAIVESLGILICRCDKGRDSKVAVMQLSELRRQSDILPLSKADMKRFCMDRTKGCHLFELSRAHIQPVRLVVAVNRRLQIYAWRCTTACSSLSSWNQFTSSAIIASFHFVRELPTFEMAQVVSVLDSNSGVHLCIGYKNQFDLIHEKSGDTVHLYRTDMLSRSAPISILDLYSEEEPELLLCYNRTCHFQKIRKANQSPDAPGNTEADFSWNFEPKNIILALPYILAFTHNAIEIRLVVNGSLVHTMSVPNCRLITSKMDLFFSTSVDNLSKQLIERTRPPTMAATSATSVPALSCSPTERQSPHISNQHQQQHVQPISSISFDRSFRITSSVQTDPSSTDTSCSSPRHSLPLDRQHIYRIPLSSLSGCGPNEDSHTSPLSSDTCVPGNQWQQLSPQSDSLSSHAPYFYPTADSTTP